MSQDQSRPESETREADAGSGGVAHEADRPATAEEERRADSNELDPAVAESYREANQRGAAQEGEGRVP
jgi:hypothetical protein